LGALPNSGVFAGVSLTKPMPGGALYRCRNCKLVFRFPVLIAEEYGELYAKAGGAAWSSAAWIRNDQALARKYITARYPMGARILDLGCWTGDFLASLPAGYQKFGIEKSEDAAECCRQRGIKIIGGDFYAANPLTEKFDAVIAMNVIEHVLDPGVFVENALNMLSSNGVLLMTTGDSGNRVWQKQKADFWYCAFAEHISFISEEWLKANALVNRFRIARVRTFKFENQFYWKAIAVRCLSYLLRALRLQLPRSWMAQASEDHLFAVLEPIR
jgi:2-polyprenyl-3-methyl-5-hydroxy-6-metoxy-1,4-benzoquinol methylase